MTVARSVTATFNTTGAARGTFGNNGNPWAIAASGTTRIQAENFDTGGEGVAYHDTDTANSGGQYRTEQGVDIETTTDTGGGSNVGWVNAGEWLEYTVNVAAAGTYDLKLRLARQPSGTSTVMVLFGGVDKTGSLAVPSTGGWQTWTDFSRTGVEPLGRAAVHAHRHDRRELQPQLDRDHGGDAHEPDVDGHEDRHRQRHRHLFARGHQLRQRLQRELCERGRASPSPPPRAPGRRLPAGAEPARAPASCAVSMTRGAIGDGNVRATTPVATIYGDALATDWASWSWSATIDFNGTSPVRIGTRAINVTYQAWGGLSLRKGTAQSTSGYTALKFWVHGGTGAAKSLRVYTQTADAGGESTSVVVSAPANTWTEITVPLGSLGNPPRSSASTSRKTAGPRCR